jgi:preprotein translocase subunit YajC
MENSALAIINAVLGVGGPVGPGPAPNPIMGMLPILVMVVLFYYLLIRPQRMKLKQHDALVGAIKPGDKVVTNGGILGVIVTIKDKTVSIRSGDSKFEMTKASIAELAQDSTTPKN